MSTTTKIALTVPLAVVSVGLMYLLAWETHLWSTPDALPWWGFPTCFLTMPGMLASGFGCGFVWINGDAP
jgi:hypothetical protein